MTSTPDRDAFHVYDTTLRDGAQREGISYSVSDKLAVARLLDELGVGFIEGGWPGALPKDTEFFARARDELRPRARAARRLRVDPQGRRRASRTTPRCRRCSTPAHPVITLVAKSDVRHVAEALRTTPEENLAMVRDTVAHLVAAGRRVFVDCEHFFDGYFHDPRLRRRAAASVAAEAGMSVGVLCDTNGGTLPSRIGAVVADVRERSGVRAGHPLPGRHRLRGREHHRRGRGRRDPRPVHGQRVRRAHRQRRPVRGRGQPRDEARHARAARGQAARDGARLARAGRHRQHRRRTPTRPTSASRRSRTRRGCTRARSR